MKVSYSINNKEISSVFSKKKKVLKNERGQDIKIQHKRLNTNQYIFLLNRNIANII